MLISEFGVEISIPFAVDETKLNDYVFINPVNPAFDVDTVKKCDFIVYAKNGGNVESVTIDGVHPD